MIFAGIESKPSKENGKKLRRHNLYPKALLRQGKGTPSQRRRDTFAIAKQFSKAKRKLCCCEVEDPVTLASGSPVKDFVAMKKTPRRSEEDPSPQRRRPLVAAKKEHPAYTKFLFRQVKQAFTAAMEEP